MASYNWKARPALVSIGLVVLASSGVAQGGPIPPVGIAKPGESKPATTRTNIAPKSPFGPPSGGVPNKNTPPPVLPAPKPRLLPPEDDRRP